MAAIREIKPGEDPSAVFAAMSNSANSSDDDYEESDDDLYDDEDDDEDYDVDDEFSIYSKITEGRVSAKVLDKLRQERKATRVMRIPSFCHDDDDNFETECGHCTCDKHKKILSFMDACVKLGFQLLSSDFEKSFKPLQNAFHSSQKSTPIKQLNGVALSVKRVCNYALEQSCNGYIEKFKKFIQKEMADPDLEHIEFLIEMHFEMKENFDCYSKNYVLLLAIANQLKPAYNEAVAYRVSSKAFKESQAIDRFLKTQEDIKNALIHYEKVLAEIKEKFDEQHDLNLELPNTPESIRSLMTGSFWTSVECDHQQAELESSSEHIDVRSFELELEQESSKTSQGGTNASGGKGKKNSKISGSNEVISTNEAQKPEKAKKTRKKTQTKTRAEFSPCVEGSCVSKGNYSSRERLLKTVHSTTMHCERAFKIKNHNPQGKKCSNNSSRERSASSTRKSGTDSPLSRRISISDKLKHSCLVRNFDCCDGKLEVELKDETKNESEVTRPEEETPEVNPEADTVDQISDEKPPSPGTFFRPEDYLDEFDEIDVGDMSEFITVNSKRNNNKNKGGNKSNSFDVNSFSSDANSKKSDPFQSDDFGQNSSFHKGRGLKPYNPVIGNNTIVMNGQIDSVASKAFDALGSTTNSMTVSQKMMALMSSEPKPQMPVFVQPENSSVQEVRKPSEDDQSNGDSSKADNTDSIVSCQSEIGSGNVDIAFGNGPFLVNKPKPISKPVATVDPCKSDKPSVVTTSAKSVDKWNSVGLFSSGDPGSNENLDPPIFQGYSPFNGTDRLRAVQDSMAQYTNKNITPKPNEFDNSVKEPITSDLGFSGFSNATIYTGIFSNPTSISKENSTFNGRFGTRPPGFDIASDLLKCGTLDYRAKNELSPDLDLKSNLNPTASVFNPTVANAHPISKDFFPSANPPGSLFQRSNSTPDAPFLSKPPMTSNFATEMPRVSSIPSRAKEDTTSHFFPPKNPTLSRVDFLKLYKEQMHLHLRFVNSEIDGVRTKLMLLEKLKNHTTHIEDFEISGLLVELQARMKDLRDGGDNIYCLYKHNIRLLSSFDVSYDQLFPIESADSAIASPNAKLERLFTAVSFS